MKLNLNDFDVLDIDNIQTLTKDTIMYDIEVEDDNTFYISKNQKDNILVHNCDGNHIRGLLMNLFDTYWPELLHMDFVYDFTTPIIKATKGKIYKYYYKLSDYQKDKNNLRGFDIKWIKGLGTIEPDEMKEFFKKIEKHLIRFHYDKEETKDMIDMLFNSKRADDRKDWLKSYQPTEFIDKLSVKQTYDKFINNELMEFSMYNNVRQIQNSIDGFKPSQRKVFYTLIKKNIQSDIKVSSLSGAIIDQAAYHHGNCLDFDTEIILADESKIKIGEWAERYPDVKLLVKCIDDNNNETIGIGKNAISLKSSDEYYEIEMEDGSIIKCTEDHKFYVNDNWIECKNLEDKMELFNLDKK